MENIDELIQSLQNESGHTAYLSVTKLLEIEDPRVRGLLVEFIKDNRKHDQYSKNQYHTKAIHEAIYGLTKFECSSVINAFDDFLDSDNSAFYVRETAINALGRFEGASVLKLLVRSINDDDIDIRRAATQSMGSVKDPMAIEYLVGALKDEDSEVRLTSIHSIRSIKSPGRVKYFVSALQDTNWIVRRQAAEYLPDFNWKSSDDEENIAFLFANGDFDDLVSRYGSKATKQLIHALNEYDSNGAFEAAKALGEIKDTLAVEPLVNALDSISPNVRAEAVEALGKIDGSSVIESIIDRLQDSDSDVARNAATVLGSLRDLHKIESPFIEILNEPSQPSTRVAIDSLGEIRSKKALPLLIEAYKDEYLRENVIEALQKYTEDLEIVIPVLLKAINEDYPRHQAKAEEAFQVIGEDAIRYLSRTISDTNVSLRVASVKALGFIGHQAVSNLVQATTDNNIDVRYSAIESLGKTASRINIVAPVLVNHMNDENKNIRLISIWALGCYGPSAKNELDSIMDILVSNIEDEDIRYKATEALCRIDLEKTKHALTQHLTCWRINETIEKLLSSIEWKPITEIDRIHQYVAKRNGNMLRENWNSTKSVLLDDVNSRPKNAISKLLAGIFSDEKKNIETNHYDVIENALYAFVGVGNNEIITELIDGLDNNGNKVMAEAYLNCGHSELVDAAMSWAKRHGYNIQKGAGANPVSWGQL